MKCEKREFSFDFKQILHPVHPQCSHKQTNPSFDFIKMSIRNIRTNGPIKFCSQYPHADRTRFALSVFFFHATFSSLALRGVAFYGFWSHVHTADVFRVHCGTMAPFLCCSGRITYHRDLNIDEFLVAKYEIEKKNHFSHFSCSSAIESSEENFVWTTTFTSKLCGVCQFTPALCTTPFTFIRLICIEYCVLCCVRLLQRTINVRKSYSKSIEMTAKQLYSHCVLMEVMMFSC